MSTVDQTGYGDIIQEDFVRLMESKGFRVDHARTIPLEYKLDKDFVKNFFKQTIMTSFPELVGDKRTEFFKEYIPRVRELSTIVRGIIYNSPVGLSFSRILTATTIPILMELKYSERK